MATRLDHVFARAIKRRGRGATAPGWAVGAGEEYAALCRPRLPHVAPVRGPLVLISQISRSGGSLLSQLLAGPPGCHPPPPEPRIGRPDSRHWPKLDLDR